MSETNEKELPNGWAITSLEDIVEILDGQRVPVNSRERACRSGDVPYYGATGQVGWIDEPLFNEPLVLLGEDGAPFFDKTRHVAYLIKGKTWVNNHAHVLRGERGIELALLAQQLNVVDYHGFVTGTTRWKLSQAPMRKIPLRVPPEAEQERIADTLDELLSDLDAGVATLERVRAKLKHYRAAVLKAAVEGSLTADWRAQHQTTEPASDLLTRILAERRRRWEAAQLQKFKDQDKSPPKDWKAKYPEPTAPDTTNLPQLPEGWCWATGEQLSWSAGYGTSEKCSETNSGGLAVLRIPNIVGGRLSLDDLKFARPEYIEDEHDLVSKGDLLIVRTNGSRTLIGRGAVIQETPSQPFSFASYLIRMRLIPSDWLLGWVSLLWQSPFVRQWIEKRAATSAGQHNISLSVLQTLAVPLPPSVEQTAIVELVEAQLSVIDHLEADLEAKLKSAQALRQSILRDAFEGKLVPQDPNDEPASELLKRIATEREERAKVARTEKHGKARPGKRKPHPPPARP